MANLPRAFESSPEQIAHEVKNTSATSSRPSFKTRWEKLENKQMILTRLLTIKLRQKTWGKTLLKLQLKLRAKSSRSNYSAKMAVVEYQAKVADAMRENNLDVRNKMLTEYAYSTRQSQRPKLL